MKLKIKPLEKPIKVNGVQYESIRLAAKSLGVSEQSLGRAFIKLEKSRLSTATVNLFTVNTFELEKVK